MDLEGCTKRERRYFLSYATINEEAGGEWGLLLSKLM